jgi:hypothetical protein
MNEWQCPEGMSKTQRGGGGRVVLIADEIRSGNECALGLVLRVRDSLLAVLRYNRRYGVLQKRIGVCIGNKTWWEIERCWIQRTAEEELRAARKRTRQNEE